MQDTYKTIAVEMIEEKMSGQDIIRIYARHI
jgi:hypothetical protein